MRNYQHRWSTSLIKNDTGPINPTFGTHLAEPKFYTGWHMGLRVTRVDPDSLFKAAQLCMLPSYMTQVAVAYFMTWLCVAGITINLMICTETTDPCWCLIRQMLEEWPYSPVQHSCDCLPEGSMPSLVASPHSAPSQIPHPWASRTQSFWATWWAAHWGPSSKLLPVPVHFEVQVLGLQ